MEAENRVPFVLRGGVPAREGVGMVGVAGTTLKTDAENERDKPDPSCTFDSKHAATSESTRVQSERDRPDVTKMIGGEFATTGEPVAPLAVHGRTFIENLLSREIAES
jgi:hypothetical protein